MFYILLILIFCKNNALVTFEEQGAVEKFLLNVLLIVVKNCFSGIRLSQLYCFSLNDVSLKSTLVSS